MSLYVELFHGRTTPNQKLEGWGTTGPIFKCDSVSETYATGLRLNLANGNSHDLTYDNCLIFYDGMYYGDIEIHSSSTFKEYRQDNDPVELNARIQKYDDSKAHLPIQGSK